MTIEQKRKFRILYQNGKPIIYHLSGVNLSECTVLDIHYFIFNFLKTTKPNPHQVPIVVELDFKGIKFVSVASPFEVLRKEDGTLSHSYTCNNRRGLLGYHTICKLCNGDGKHNPTSVLTCIRCNGTGKEEILSYEKATN